MHPAIYQELLLSDIPGFVVRASMNQLAQAVQMLTGIPGVRSQRLSSPSTDCPIATGDRYVVRYMMKELSPHEKFIKVFPDTAWRIHLTRYPGDIMRTEDTEVQIRRQHTDPVTRRIIPLLGVLRDYVDRCPYQSAER